MQNKVWFIKVDGQKEGPFSIQELKNHPQMTPDTLVWKEGFKDWIPARHVPELKSVFEDEEPEELKDRFKIKATPSEDAILALERSNYPFLIYGLIILLILFAYLFYKFHGF